MAQTRMLEVEAERSGKILDIFLRVESKAFLLSGGRDLKDDSKVLFCFVLFFIFFIFIIIFYLLILFYFWLCWVFVSVQGLSLVAASGGHSSLRCAGLSLSRPLLLWSTSSRRAGSVVVAHGPRCSAACGIFPHQGSNLRPLH